MFLTMRLAVAVALLACLMFLSSAKPQTRRLYPRYQPRSPDYRPLQAKDLSGRALPAMPLYQGFGGFGIHPYGPMGALSHLPLTSHLPYMGGFMGHMGYPFARMGLGWPYMGYPRNMTSRFIMAPYMSAFFPQMSRAGRCDFEKPFLCWGTKFCVGLDSVCDDVYDCPNAFEEHRQLCVTARRPSVVTVRAFLDNEPWTVEKWFNNNDKNIIASTLRFVNGIDELAYFLALPDDMKTKVKTVFENISKNNKTEAVAAGGPELTENNYEDVKTFVKSLLESSFRLV